jgi:autophagy-related protein 5
LIESEVHPWDGWLSFERVPLKWHHPVGLLFDLYSGAKDRLLDDNGDKDEVADTEDGEGQSCTLAWKLVVHFSNWPKEQLVKLDEAGKVLQDAFVNSLKEVCLSSFERQCRMKWF